MSNKTDFSIQFGCLINYRGKDKNVVIPDDVTVIGRRAFYQNNYIIMENNIATEDNQPKKYYKYSIGNEDYFINLSDVENKHYSQNKILEIDIKEG